MPRKPLTADERDHIHERLSVDRSVPYAEVARELGRHRSTISREVTRNGGRNAYRPSVAGDAAASRRRRPKTLLFAVESPLRARVIELLSEGYSPVAAAALVCRQPDDGTVCAETLYQAVYGGTLGLKAAECLRSRRARRKRRRAPTSARASPLGPNVVPISERPNEATEGAPGHWEGDLIIGARNQSAALTLVERSTGFQLVYALPNGYQAELVIAALVRWVESTPAGMCQSLTWDRGSEMAHWEVLTGGWGLPVFFCDPHAPWQRPKNENSNRQLRFWFPKGKDLRDYNQADYDHACAVLNSQPRRQYGLQSAGERYAEALACNDR
ncbi:MAG: IS30 family transposase [Candidatus Microthrix subdominans]